MVDGIFSVADTFPITCNIFRINLIDKIKAILNDENDKRDATDVIDSASSRNLYDENKDDHYFIVTLCNIDLQYPALLNKDIIADYLREVAPVDYSAQFRNQLIMTSVSGEYEELQKKCWIFPNLN